MIGRMTRLILLASISLSLLTTACTRTESEDILTSGMYAAMSATTTGNGTTTVSATLMLGNPIDLNFIDLTADDQLVALWNTQAKRMEETIILNIVAHSTTFQTGNEGDEFSVAFDRTVDGGAPNSFVALPAAFAFAAPPASASRAAPLSITYGPSGTSEAMRWRADGSCIDSAVGNLTGDPGVIELPANTFVKKQNGVETICPITFALERVRDGQLDPAFGKGGQILGVQSRTTTFSSTP